MPVRHEERAVAPLLTPDEPPGHAALLRDEPDLKCLALKRFENLHLPRKTNNIFVSERRDEKVVRGE